MKPANALFFVGLLALSILHLAPLDPPCPSCGEGVELLYKQSVSYPFKVRAGEHYRLKLVVKSGDVIMDETALSKAGTLKCVDADTNVSCSFRPYKAGKTYLIITGDSRHSTHVLWFERE